MTRELLSPEPSRESGVDGPWLVAPGGWRYALLGGDGEWLVILGHVSDEVVAAVLAELPEHYGVVAPDEVAPVWAWGPGYWPATVIDLEV